jgi:hypothetical protein
MENCILWLLKRTVSWTKESRGGEMAKRRAAACRAIEPECGATIPAGFCVALVETSLDEESGFQPRVMVSKIDWHGGDSISVQPIVIIRHHNDALTVCLINDFMHLGAPRRHWGRMQPFELKPGEVGQIEFNGRFSSNSMFSVSSGWHYRETRFRIHWSKDSKLDWKRLVLDSPDHTFCDLHELW